MRRHAALVAVAVAMLAGCRDGVSGHPERSEGSRSKDGHPSIAALPQDDRSGDTAHADALFADSTNRIRFAVPRPFQRNAVDPGATQPWRVNSSTPGHLLAKLTLPRDFEPGTNFQDATFTVGTSMDSSAVATCGVVTNGERARGTTTINGVSFATFDLTDAAAGNLYETMSYRTVDDHACWAVEYTIHSTNLGNYDPRQGVKAFDRGKVTRLLDMVIRSLKFS